MTCMKLRSVLKVQVCHSVGSSYRYLFADCVSVDAELLAIAMKQPSYYFLRTIEHFGQ